MECLDTILKYLCGWIKDEGVAVLLQLDDNVEGMRKEMDLLRSTKEDLENDLRRAEMQPTDSNRLPETTAKVKVWLQRVDDLDGAVTSALSEFQRRRTGTGACSPQHMWSGYDISKKAKKLQKDAEELRSGKDNLGPLVSEHPPEVAVELDIPSTVGMGSPVDQAFKYLGMEKVGVIGVHGGEGAGKTTLLKTVNNQFLVEPCGFKVVVFVEVSQQLDVGMIQDEISERLGLNLSNAKTIDRPKMLFTALSRRRFLLLLDDVWEELDLRVVGIPRPDPRNKSKIVFATRKEQPLSKMGEYKRIDLQGLEDEEAWQLLCMRLKPQGETAIRECRGLPGAIETMASTWMEKISSPVQGNIKDGLGKQLSPYQEGISQQGSSPSEEAPTKIRAVNLGGWLVAHGLVKWSPFEEIPNNDLLDGTKVWFQSVTSWKYLGEKAGSETGIVADGSGSTTFWLWRFSENSFQFRAHSGRFIGVENKGGVDVIVAVKENPGREGIFEIVESTNAKDRVRIKASNGFFLQVKNETLVTADSNGNDSWEDNDPSIFKLHQRRSIYGEFQLTNGLGPLKAPSVMNDHWNTFIEEDDFRFISEQGLDAVRIPVGWWIACFPTPPPFVRGSLAALDNAFEWAEKYGLKVIVELRAAPGSQYGGAYDATRDSWVEWGTTSESIEQSIHVIEFLTARYTRRPSLYAVQLLSFPAGRYISYETLRRYYVAGYDAVRKYSSSAYVIVAHRLSESKEEFIPFARGRSRVVLDVQYYNLWNSKYEKLSVQQHIDYVNADGAELEDLMKANGGPLIFVGEWLTHWKGSGMKEDHQKLAKAQLDAYGRASFGWAYINYKDNRDHFSFKWMINKGYISL